MSMPSSQNVISCPAEYYIKTNNSVEKFYDCLSKVLNFALKIRKKKV